MFILYGAVIDDLYQKIVHLSKLNYFFFIQVRYHRVLSLSYVRKSVGFVRMLPIVPGTHHPLPLWRCGVPQSASGHPATWSLCQLSLPGSAPVSGWVGVVVMGGDKGQGPKEREKI